jgi:hypothetical protein
LLKFETRITTSIPKIQRTVNITDLFKLYLQENVEIQHYGLSAFNDIVKELTNKDLKRIIAINVLLKEFTEMILSLSLKYPKLKSLLERFSVYAKIEFKDQLKEHSEDIFTCLSYSFGCCNNEHKETNKYFKLLIY